jgi:hypothetical protein
MKQPQVNPLTRRFRIISRLFDCDRHVPHSARQGAAAFPPKKPLPLLSSALIALRKQRELAIHGVKSVSLRDRPAIPACNASIADHRSDSGERKSSGAAEVGTVIYEGK